MHYEDIDFHANQLCCQLGESIVRPRDLRLCDDEFLPRTLPKLWRAGFERGPPGLVEVGRIRRQESYPPHFYGLLGLARTRSSQDAPTDHCDERSPVHHSMT